MQQYYVGFGSFKKHQASKELKELLTADVIDTLKEQREWWICHGEYNEQHWTQIFKNMTESRAFKVELGRNLNPKMIKEVSDVHFTCLRALCFGKNKIDNIEAIVKIDAPNLEWLSFQQNYITSLKPLRRAFFPKLKILNLKFNKIREIDLAEFRAPNLSKLCLEFHYEEPKQGEYLSWVFKLQTINLKILRCRNASRIQNNLFEKQFKAKYPESDVKRYLQEADNSESESDKE